MKTTALGDFLGDLDTRALYHDDKLAKADSGTRLDNLANAKEDMEAKTLCDKLIDVEAEAVVDMLADTLSQMQAKTLSDTLVKVERKALVDTLPDTLTKTAKILVQNSSI